jgi:TM2 domain-containing membrane protein YozV
VPTVHDPQAPYGRDPVTGRPYSDRLKVIAALLQLFLPFGTGRFYTGHTGIAIAQLVLVVFGIGVVWSFIDGIVLLAGDPTDPDGRPLRP